MIHTIKSIAADLVLYWFYDPPLDPGDREAITEAILYQRQTTQAAWARVPGAGNLWQTDGKCFVGLGRN